MRPCSVDWVGQSAVPPSCRLHAPSYRRSCHTPTVLALQLVKQPEGSFAVRPGDAGRLTVPLQKTPTLIAFHHP